MKTYNLTINGNAYEVAIDFLDGTTAHVSVNGTPYEVEVGTGIGTNGRKDMTPEGECRSYPNSSPSQAAAVTSQNAVARSEHGGGDAETKVTAPLPGVIIEVSVKEGQMVKAGEKVAVLEAMKMENEITAPREGTVTAIYVSKGDSVLEGAPVVSIA